jgi:hypothetical protein
MIRRCYYISNNFQDSNKRKITEIKNIGLSLKSAFLNAFELDAESANQVISSKALASTGALRLPFLPFLTLGKT